MARSAQHPADIDDALSVVMFPFLAFGHISPFVQLSAKLSAVGGVSITFLTTPSSAPRVSAMLHTAAGKSTQVRILPLNLPHVDGLPEGAESTDEVTPMGAELLKVALDKMQPQIGALLADLQPDLIVHDFTHNWIHSLAQPLGIKTVYFSVYSAVNLAFICVPSRSQLEGADEAEIQKALQLPPPGFPSPPESTIESIPKYQAANFAYAFMHFFGMPSVYCRFTESIQNCSAIAFKSCMDVEGPYLSSIQQEYDKPIFLVGPLVPEPPPKEDVLDPKWALWLDRFPEESVIFCSFGSETFLSDDGIKELAMGLEMTGRPFLLVINFPKAIVEEPDSDSVIEVDPLDRLRTKLPEGLVDRVADRGMFHSGWVQQKLILSHKSVGCFLCHAGLSSLTEGLLAGCQLVLLPQKTDQFLNSRLFAGDLRAAVEVRRRDEDGWFDREDIRDAVSKVTANDENGRQVRNNHHRWRRFFGAAEATQPFMVEFVEKMRALVADKG